MHLKRTLSLNKELQIHTNSHPGSMIRYVLQSTVIVQLVEARSIGTATSGCRTVGQRWTKPTQTTAQESRDVN